MYFVNIWHHSALFDVFESNLKKKIKICWGKKKIKDKKHFPACSGGGIAVMSPTV